MVRGLNIMYLKRSLGTGFIEPTHVLSLSILTKKSRDTSKGEREQVYRCLQLCPIIPVALGRHRVTS